MPLRRLVRVGFLEYSKGAWRPVAAGSAVEAMSQLLKHRNFVFQNKFLPLLGTTEATAAVLATAVVLATAATAVRGGARRGKRMDFG